MARQDMCLNHGDRPAVIRCRQCGKSICDQCVVSVTEGKFCSGECVGKFRDFAARGVQVSKPKSGMSPMAKLILVLIVLASLAIIVWKSGLIK